MSLLLIGGKERASCPPVSRKRRKGKLLTFPQTEGEGLPPRVKGFSLFWYGKEKKRSRETSSGGCLQPLGEGVILARRKQLHLPFPERREGRKGTSSLSCRGSRKGKRSFQKTSSSPFRRGKRKGKLAAIKRRRQAFIIGERKGDLRKIQKAASGRTEGGLIQLGEEKRATCC